MPPWAATEHPKATAREKHSYIQPGKFKRLQHDQFVNSFHVQFSISKMSAVLLAHRDPDAAFRRNIETCHSFGKILLKKINNNERTPSKLMRQFNRYNNDNLRLHYGAVNAKRQVAIELKSSSISHRHSGQN